MDREEQKMGQGGLKILFGPKKLFFCSEIGFGACGIVWSLPAMLPSYWEFGHQGQLCR